MIVARRAPPVDVLRRFAGREVPVLPEILAGAGAPAAVQTVNDGRGNAARFQNQARNARGQLAALADGGGDRPFVLVGGLFGSANYSTVIRCGL